MADENDVRKDVSGKALPTLETSVPGVIDPKNRIPGRIQTADQVPEDHIYLQSVAANGQNLLWEADLLGVPTLDEGHGKLPDQIHMICPFCSDKEVEAAILINPENHPYEIEDLKEPVYVPTNTFRGPVNFPVTRLLSVKRRIQCPTCTIKFEVRGGVINKC
jgi:hypothetical protein